jgi:superoxide dismutase, Fe-Mn family
LSYTLPDLQYAYDALEPKISAKAMEIHHGKHHAKYVGGANEAIESLRDAPTALVPGLHQSLAFNLSGHLLHSLYWNCLSPEHDQRPTGALLDAVNSEFGSYDDLASRLTAAITTTQGSGWAALVWEPLGQRLQVAQIHDHQSATIVGADLILVADAWEHAHYLDYQSDKAAWAAAFLSLANWTFASDRFEMIAAGMASAGTRNS